MFPMPDYAYALYCAMYSIFSLLALLLVRMQLYIAILALYMYVQSPS